MSERRRTVKRKKPRLKFNKRMSRNLGIIYILIVGFLFVLCGKIAYLNVAKGDDYSIQVLQQQSFTSRVIPYKRGDIKDRNGNVLATSVMVYNLVIDAKLIMADEEKYLEPTVYALVKYFGFKEDDLLTGIREHKKSNYWVARKELKYEEIKEFQEYVEGKFADTREEKERVRNTQGVWFEKQYKRMYPYNSLACSVLGFSNINNEASIGIECSYSGQLNGLEGREYGYMDAENNMEMVIKDAEDGNSVISSIDMNIQRIVQKAITKYMEKYKPKRIAVVIADPNTGEILAMSDDKTFNLNKPTNAHKGYSNSEWKKLSKEKQAEVLNSVWSNYCITDSFEPGSTAKAFTVAAGIEEGVINKKTTYTCDGYQKVDVFTIGCHGGDGHGTIDAKEAVAMSCNDYMMYIGRLLGANEFIKYQARYGFGMKTGIDLPGETRGIIYDKERGMGEATLATNSFGQNFTVNMIQMVAGFSSLVNGGYYYEPRVVKQVVTDEGSLVKNYSKTLVKETITRETSDFIKECLRKVVLTGTGKTAAIEGYTVGGKTGTAEKVNTSGTGIGRIKGQHILSFIGCVPCENPEVVCYTLMDSPKGNTEATAYNTELWTYIMKQVLPYMGIEKTATE
ncbi:MAG: penicillin-binding protein 2 [Eubacterium sp.]|nr:penicillin-binding protein 2 [Eubacterium sp.]